MRTFSFRGREIRDSIVGWNAMVYGVSLDIGEKGPEIVRARKFEGEK